MLRSCAALVGRLARRAASPTAFAALRVVVAPLGASLLLASCAGSAPPAANSSPLMVAAAASLREVVPALLADFAGASPSASGASPGASGAAPIVSFGASGTLCSQVEAGAPVHVVMFAGDDPVSRLINGGLVVASSRAPLAGNELVLAGPAAGAERRFADLGALDRGQLIGLGNPEFVPAGSYARSLLTSLGLWIELQRAGQLVFAGDVTQALVWLSRGEVDLALVYATDLRGHDQLRIFDRSRAPQVEPTVVGAITTAGSAHPRSAPFMTYLRSEAAAQIFTRFGFSTLDISTLDL